jgi:hypothetical protein
MSEALRGVAIADLPGNYRFRDPANVALAGRVPPAEIGADGRPLVLDPLGNRIAEANQGWFDEPPAGDPGERPRRRGFFERLFGG